MRDMEHDGHKDAELRPRNLYDGFGCGERPYFINVPEAAPPSLSTASVHVNMFMDSMRLLQAMAPEQAAKILKDTAALQGPYED